MGPGNLIILLLIITWYLAIEEIMVQSMEIDLVRCLNVKGNYHSMLCLM